MRLVNKQQLALWPKLSLGPPTIYPPVVNP